MNWQNEKPFKNNTILSRLQARKNVAVAKILQTSFKARQMSLANHYEKMKSKDYLTTNKPRRRNIQNLFESKSNLGESDRALYSDKNNAELKNRWFEFETQYNTIMNLKRKSEVKEDDFIRTTIEILQKIISKWSDWDKAVIEDSVYKLKCDKVVAEDISILRSTSKDSIVILVNKNEKLIALQIPEAIQGAFSTEVKNRMMTDTKHFYTHIKYANSDHNKRHISKQSHLSRRYDSPDSDHFDSWHETDETKEPVKKTGDASSCVLYVKQCLLHFLENTEGTMIKLLDFWFGVWEPDLREQYRNIYRRLPKYARLPPTNEDWNEIYTLRVVVVNRDTDRHSARRFRG